MQHLNNRQRMTYKTFFKYKICFRHVKFLSTFRAKKLFQQFFINTWTLTERKQLEKIRHNQVDLRTNIYHGLMDATD